MRNRTNAGLFNDVANVEKISKKEILIRIEETDELKKVQLQDIFKMYDDKIQEVIDIVEENEQEERKIRDADKVRPQRKRKLPEKLSDYVVQGTKK